MQSCLHTHTQTHTHTNTHTHTHTHTHMHTPAHKYTHTHARTHLHTKIHLDTRRHFRAGGLNKKKLQTERFSMKIWRNWQRMPDRLSRGFVLCCWRLVLERALTNWLCAKGWYSEHLGVCRRTELPRRSEKVKKVRKVARGRTIQRFKAKWSEF